MKTFLKSLLTLILATAFLFTGCDTTDTSSEGSAVTSSNVSEISSADVSSNITSSTETSSVEISSIAESSVATSSSYTSSATNSEYTDVADVPDEIWQRILDSQYTTEPPMYEEYESWEEIIGLMSPRVSYLGGKQPDDLSTEKVLIPKGAGFYTRSEKDEMLSRITESNSLLVLIENGNNPTSVYVFNDDCSKGIRIFTYGIFPEQVRVETVYDDPFPSVYKYRWTWFEFSLNDARKQSLINSELDLSKTTATQMTIGGLGYGYVLSDGEHEYFMRTNDYDMFDHSDVPTVVSEYEKLCSYDEVVALLTEYDHFTEDGKVIFDPSGGGHIDQLKHD